MKNTKKLTNLQKDLQDSSAGLNSGVYDSLHPILNAPGPTSPDLHENIRQGLVGLEYLTGAKKNTVDTFFDEHPIQATTTDALRNSKLLGALITAGGIGLNTRRQSKNFEAAVPKDPEALKNILNTNDDDMSDLFGANKTQDRLNIIDKLNKSNFSQNLQDMEHSYGWDLNAAEAAKNQAEQDLKNLLSPNSQATKLEIEKAQKLLAAKKEDFDTLVSRQKKDTSDLFDKANIAGNKAGLKDYADLHESLKQSKGSGKLKKSFGEGLRKHLGDSKASQFIKTHILPQEGQHIVDFLQRQGLDANNPNVDIDLVKKVIAKNFGDESITSGLRKTLETHFNPKAQSSKIINFLRKNRFPIYAGAGTAAAGTGLYYLLKAIQNQMYPADQQQEWKKNILKSQGKFREAERL